jgi:Family of unknown function (DUF5519)
VATIGKPSAAANLFLAEVESEVLSWPGVTVRPHRFGGNEFRFGKAEVGHLHPEGIVDIPFTRRVRDVLLADGKVERHHVLPHSGWIRFRVLEQEQVLYAVWLMRLSYLRYAVRSKLSAAQKKDFDAELARLTTDELYSALKASSQ